MATPDLPKPDFARNLTLIGHSDQGGRPDGVQLMVSKGHAFIGHMFSQGFSVVDVRNPRDPKPVAYVAAPPNHLERPSADRRRPAARGECKGHVRGARVPGRAPLLQGRARQEGWHRRRRDRRRPRLDRRDDGLRHRRPGGRRGGSGSCRSKAAASTASGTPGGRWAYVSALLDGFTDYIFVTVDMQDPTRPREAGRLWLPGMNAAAGETPGWPATRRYGLHHATVSGDVAYGAWRDAGLVMIDVAERTQPKLMLHRNWSPPLWWRHPQHPGAARPRPAGRWSTRRCSTTCEVRPQADLGVRCQRAVETRSASRPFRRRRRSTMPSRAAHFGPHNIHENRRRSFVSSQDDLREPTRMPASGFSTSAISTGRARPPPSSHRRPAAWSTTGRTGPA